MPGFGWEETWLSRCAHTDTGRQPLIRKRFWESKDEPADGCMGKPEQWAVSWGETRGKDCGEGQAGIHPGRSVRVVGSQQEGREEAQALPQFRETQPLS